MCKILLASDDALELEALKIIIYKNAKNVNIVGMACNGNEAINMNNKLNPDIIFIDTMLPEIDGFEVVNIIKKSYNNKQVILMSIYDNFEYLKKALKVKADDYLLKPIKSENIIEILNEYRKNNKYRIYNENLSNEYKLNKVLNYIKKNFKKNITLKEVADYMNYSSTYFSKSFKKHVGVNFNKYITQIRIREAKFLLRESNISINDLSFNLGYNEPNYFCKVFKKEEGITPSEYREQNDIKL
ncbi:response regulator transcription factor [Clostridium taeniosporum]|uniref:Stage 0 sporulation protein A homolog n=1 Tax=Clostridium taeniosporum TaxID=394958 RepID=A0A1D7XJW6_9CLOT|nr:helix-turn-helix domain-containing protein [Clostridium taeniosporum]AOR23644.1 DNA-binding response regulator [Clostridium taeniosporum]